MRYTIKNGDMTVSGVSAGIIQYAYEPAGRVPLRFECAGDAADWWRENAPTLPLVGYGRIQIEDTRGSDAEHVRLLCAETNVVIASEPPSYVDGDGWTTDSVIDQSVRDESARSAAGIVRVSCVAGRWSLDPAGQRAYVA